MRAMIVDQLATLASKIENVAPDPVNARRGNVEAIRRSLSMFGQRKPIVVRRTGSDVDGNPTGIVMAGNHTLAAAIELGWSHLAAVFVDDDETLAKAYALADNRTGELATWDNDQLQAALRELSSAEVDMSALGWTELQLAALMNAGEFSPEDEEAPRLDQRAPIMCPQCSFEWRVGPQGEIQPV